jgi:hypothetical protein
MHKTTVMNELLPFERSTCSVSLRGLPRFSGEPGRSRMERQEGAVRPTNPKENLLSRGLDKTQPAVAQTGGRK